MGMREIYNKVIKQVEREEGEFHGNFPKLLILKRIRDNIAYNAGKYAKNKNTGKIRSLATRVAIVKKLEEHPEVARQILLHEAREIRFTEKGKSSGKVHLLAVKKESKEFRRKFKTYEKLARLAGKKEFGRAFKERSNKLIERINEKAKKKTGRKLILHRPKKFKKRFKIMEFMS